VPNPDALAHARGRNAFAHLVDLARAVAVRNDARKGDLARQAGAALDVGRIDAGDGEAHAHLAASGPRRLHFVDAQHVAGRSVGLVIGSAHGMLPRPMDRRARACWPKMRGAAITSPTSPVPAR